MSKCIQKRGIIRPFVFVELKKFLPPGLAPNAAREDDEEANNQQGQAATDLCRTLLVRSFYFISAFVLLYECVLLYGCVTA